MTLRDGLLDSYSQNTPPNYSQSENEEPIIGQSPIFLQTIAIALRAAKSMAKIFITGESGTGKEILARLIHHNSLNRSGPFVAINCSAIPEQLLESEFFGHTKGSFTGAREKRVGLFEEAQNGTLFLDEIGDMSLSLQSKILRVLQERKIKRIGENISREINCRIISATHKNLKSEVMENRFRGDLFFRLEVIPIHIPPLRERPEDLMLLADHFLKRFAQINKSPAKSFSKSAKEFILSHTWPGNVRELENFIERAVILADNSELSLIDPSNVPSFISCDRQRVQTSNSKDCFSILCGDSLPTLDEVIQKYIQFAVNKKGGARDKTAREIGIDRKTLYKRLSLIDKT